MAPQLGWSGLGNMGRGMCKNLVEKGNLSNPLLIHNRTTSRAEELSSKLGNSSVCSSLPELVTKSDITFMCLGDDKAVFDAVDTIISGVKDLKGKTIVDCSTIHPDSTKQINSKLTSAGAEFVACPVFGAPAMADAGQLICVIAGPSDGVAKIKPYCKNVMGRAEIDFSGSEPSKATLLKLVGNTFIVSMVQSLADGHVAAEKTGLGTTEIHKFIEIMFPGPYTAYSNRMLSGDYYNRDEPLFNVNLARKDVGHAKKIADDAGCQLKIVDIADEYLQVVQKHQGDKGDMAGIYGAKRQEAGLKYENQD